VTWLAVPDMKGRTALEIDTMFESNLPCRKFKNWSPDITELKEGAV
jgi:hypothetical protein